MLLQKTPLLLAKSVGRAKKKCDDKFHINGLFCELIVLTLQCCCVPCASRQANQWLITVNAPPSPPPLPKKICSFVYLCCVMSVLNLNSLLSNILNYWRVLFLYIWFTFHWLKLWRLQIWGWNCGLQVEHWKQKKGMLGTKEARRGWKIWNEWWRWRNWVERKCGTGFKNVYGKCFWIWRLESFTSEWRGWRLKFRLLVKAPDCVLVVSTLVCII